MVQFLFQFLLLARLVRLTFFAVFYINIKNIPIWLRWLENFSYARWAFMALAINEFKGENFVCDQGPGQPCIATGQEVLDNLSFGGYSLGEPIRNLFLLWLGFHLIALFLLRINRVKYKHINDTTAPATAATQATAAQPAGAAPVIAAPTISPEASPEQTTPPEATPEQTTPKAD